MKMEESPNCKSKRQGGWQHQLQQLAKVKKGLMRKLIILFLIAVLSHITLRTINLVHTVELSNYKSDADYNMVSMIELLDDFREEDGIELEEQWQQQLRQKQQQQGQQGQKEENEKQIENNKEVEGDKNKNKKALKPDSPTTEKAETVEI
jgi:hypothetical protein